MCPPLLQQGEGDEDLQSTSHRSVANIRLMNIYRCSLHFKSIDYMGKDIVDIGDDLCKHGYI